MINKSDHDLFSRDMADHLTREDDLVFGSGTERVTEEQIVDHQSQVHIIVTKKTLLVDGQGNRFIVGIAQDITANKRAEEAVIQTRRNNEAFFNSINEFLIVLDDNGYILNINETVVRRLGFTKEELLGQSVVMMHPPERREEASGIVQEMLAGTTDFCWVPVMTRDGRLIPVETRITRGEWDGRPALFGSSKEIS